MLKVKEIYIKYDKSDKYSLEDITFQIKQGEIVGLIGENGSGKTTLLKTIGKAIKPSSGEIYIDGDNIFEKENILSNIGIMIETIPFNNLSAYNNIKFFLELNNKEEYIKNIDRILKQ